MENKSYVIKNNVTDKYIGIDNASGGYPYNTELRFAYIFRDKKEANSYYNTFKSSYPDWSLYELFTSTEKIDW